jgi:hypothetical protein
VGAAGACPGCGRTFGPWIAAAVPSGGAGEEVTSVEESRPGQRNLRGPIAFGLAALAVLALAVTLGGSFQPAGGVAGATDLSVGVVRSPSSASGRPGPTPRPLPTGLIAGAPDISSAPPGIPAAATPVPVGTAAGPTAVARPSPRPTPRPVATPRRTPAPTAARTPAPVCLTVPKLEGLTVADARSAWAAAGFSGAITPGNGHDGKTVLTQSAPAGACLPAATAVEVTF